MKTTFLSTVKKQLARPVFAASLLLPFVFGTGTARAATSDTNAALEKSGEGKKRAWYQVGLSSWYGGQFQGRKTASGEKFDTNSLTAAHRTLPLGSLVRVTNLKNLKSVIVKINDRGPYVKGRCLDLSHAAASMLGFTGTAAVKVELLDAASAMGVGAAH